MSNLIKNKVQKLEISEKTSGQRLDNFLRKTLKGVPHSLIYKIIRDGQVRVTADLLGLNDDQPPFCPPIIQGKKLLEDKLKEWVVSERLN